MGETSDLAREPRVRTRQSGMVRTHPGATPSSTQDTSSSVLRLCALLPPLFAVTFHRCDQCTKHRSVAAKFCLSNVNLE